jgi:hypothetical protein
LANIGYSWYAAYFTAGRKILFSWEGSRRSALFPRKQYLAACLNRWFCEVRVLWIGHGRSPEIRIIHAGILRTMSS